DLESRNVFSVSRTIDFLYYEDHLFILSKRDFEKALNFREGMLRKANLFYEVANELSLFSDIELIKEKIADNMKYLRKVAVIEKLAYYRSPDFLSRIREIAEKRGWDLRFNENTIIVTADNIEVVLTILANHRLLSEVTDEVFDVQHAKKV
ncbi:DUF4868 domain-containing protein, partial [Leptospira sp. id769339]|uniref:DUF4868 domain-containing protein n=1 Tax=Leptospira sp. id769339 TaxID=2864221 RepID=UPI00214CE9CF